MPALIGALCVYLSFVPVLFLPHGGTLHHARRRRRGRGRDLRDRGLAPRGSDWCVSSDVPQSNGKIERWHKSLKAECVRPATPLCVDDARRAVTRFVDTYNTKRLHSAIGYIAPADKLAGRADLIHAERDRKLAAARETRRKRRQTLGLESPRSSVASASSHPELDGVEATGRRGRPHGSSRPEAECLNDNRRRNDTERCL